MPKHNYFRWQIALTVLVSLVFVTPDAFGGAGKKAKGEYGIVVGQIGGTIFDMVTTDSLEREGYGRTDAASTGAVFFEQNTFRSFWIGLSVEGHMFYQNLGGNYDLKSTVINLSLRASFHHRSRNNKWSLRPGVAFGAAATRQIHDIDPCMFVALRPFVETVYHVSPKVGLILDLGVFSTVWGGNDKYDINIRPTVVARFGLQFSATPASRVRERPGAID